jgi:hypothetical protein
MTHTIEEIERALDIEREIMGGKGGMVPVDEIVKRAGFYPSNDERSALEVHRFVTDPPTRYFAYHEPALRERKTLGRQDRITTWTGELIGLIIEIGYSYQSNMGDWRQNFRAACRNGLIYSGTAYLSAGDYVRMRQARPHSKREADYAIVLHNATTGVAA